LNRQWMACFNQLRHYYRVIQDKFWSSQASGSCHTWQTSKQRCRWIFNRSPTLSNDSKRSGLLASHYERLFFCLCLSMHGLLYQFDAVYWFQ